MNVRTYWVVGENPHFRLSKDNCQRLIAALVASGGRIEDSDTFSFYKSFLNIPKKGELIEGITLGRADAIFSISIPAGNELIFDRWMGGSFLEKPSKIQVN